jgi:hypothetical protein
MLKWLGLGVGALTVLALGVAAFVYLLSEQMIRKTYDLPLSSIAVAIMAAMESGWAAECSSTSLS